MKTVVPKYAYALALLAAFAALAMFFLIFLQFKFARSSPMLLALGFCWLLAAAFSFVWPSGSWRWGLWVSSGFWLFLGFAFVSFLVNDEFERWPAVEALAIAIIACSGGLSVDSPMGGHAPETEE